MKILFLSISAFAYNPYGADSVAERLFLATRALRKLGHQCHILAITGSVNDEGVIIVPGQAHPSVTDENKHKYFLSPDSAMMSMFEYIRIHQHEYDVIVSLGQDYLGYWMQPYFTTPFVLIPNLIESVAETDTMLIQRYRENPLSVGFLTATQKKGITGEIHTHHDIILWEPLNSQQYVFNLEKEKNSLFWAGRIFYGKGIHNVAEVAKKLGKKLQIAGSIQDKDYFKMLELQYGIEYCGVLSRQNLSIKMAQNPVFFQLQDDSFPEAFGRITAESFLSGTPVIAFDNGANKELIIQGQNGFIVQNVEEAIYYYEQACKLDASNIRLNAEKTFDESIHAQNLLRWFHLIQNNLSSFKA
jgi:UDP-glucose:tetrahydrobiopterin glucosyltransferase